MFSQSFSDGLGIKLTERTEKPRKSGLTMIIDVGHTKQEVSDVLDSYGAYIDVIKLADPNMSQPIGEIAKKVALLKAHHVDAQPGGIIIEIARFTKKNAKLSGAFLKNLALPNFRILLIPDNTSLPGILD